MHRLPFKIPSLYADLGEAEGIATLQRDTLCLEFQTKDAIIGILKSNVKEVKITLAELNDIQFNQKLINSKLIIYADKMGTLADIPGSEKGQLTLSIARQDKLAAQKLVVDAALRIAELKLKETEE